MSRARADLDAFESALDGAGAILRGWRGRIGPATLKRDGSPVTEADREIDAYLREELRRLDPGAAWLSEESADTPERLAARRVWIVDPLDGTKEFVRGVDEVAVSFALVEDGRVVAGAVGNPFRGESGVAIVGGEARYRGLARRPVPATLAEATAVVSRTETAEGVLERYRPHLGTLDPVGSVAYKLLLAASGAVALTFSARGKSEWDVAGGVGLLLASQRTFVRRDGLELRFNRPDPRIRRGFAAGDPGLVAAFATACWTSSPRG